MGVLMGGGRRVSFDPGAPGLISIFTNIWLLSTEEGDAEPAKLPPKPPNSQLQASQTI